MKNILKRFIALALLVPALAFGQAGQFGSGVTDLSTLAAPYKDGAFSGTLYANQFSLVPGTTSPAFTCASGTITASAPCLNITQTWNNAAETFVGADMLITESASGQGSLFQRWRSGAGTTVATIGKGGAGVIRAVQANGTATALIGVAASTIFPATATTSIEAFRSAPTVSDGGGATFAQVVGFRAAAPVKSGAGDTFTKSVGFLAASASASVLNLGFEGQLVASGTARYNLYMSGTAPNYLQGGLLLGNVTAVGVNAGAFSMAKITASGSAPGADSAKFEVVCGTNAGTAKLQMYAGTSATPVTVLDNVGAGVTGC